MLKVVIADDERRVRNVVMKKGRWEELELLVAGEAQNGRELLELAKKQVPDIILTDMKMPGLHGAELLKVLGEQFPGTKVIVISGYDDFDYMKQAIISKATDYILKPISEADLNGALKKAVCEIQAERLNESVIFKAGKREPLVIESIFQMYMQGAELEKEILQYLGKEETDSVKYRVSVIKLAGFTRVCKELFENDSYILSSAVINIVDELIQGRGKSVNIQNQNAVVVIHSEDAKSQDIMSLLLCIIESLNKYLHLDVIAGTGEEYQSAAEIRKSCEEAWFAVFHQNIKADKKFAFYHDVKRYPQRTARKDRVLDQLEAALRSGNEKTILQALKCVYESVDHGTVCSLKTLDAVNHSVIRTLEMFCQKENYPADLLLEKLETLLEDEYCADSIIGQIMNIIAQVLKDSQALESDNLIFAVQNFVEENYASKITLDDISEKFWISKQHLLKLYKQQFGTTPYAHMMDLKIDKAKLLLIEDRMKVVEIAELLNFTDESHFSRNFKKYTGLSPREFKNQYKKK